MKEPNLRLKRAEYSLRALSIGDAFGEQFFFSEDGYIISEEMVLDMARTRQMPGAPRHFTDDTVMAISIVDVLRERGQVDQDRLAELFGLRYTLDRHRGYGGTAYGILKKLSNGASWRQVASDVFDGSGSMGNGGAMRAPPIGAYFAEDLDAVAEAARLSAEVTHAHPEGQAGAIAVAMAAAVVTRGETDPRSLFLAVLSRTPAGEVWAGVERASRLHLGYDVRTAASVLGNGKLITAPDTVPFVLWCAARHLGHFEDAMWTTVSGLGDRDTTCAMVAGIVAMGHGVAIPEEWESGTEPLSTMSLEGRSPVEGGA